ncbi:MAG: hypothetical protein ABIR84_04425 [Candidatus Nitrotoga sp.]
MSNRLSMRAPANGQSICCSSIRRISASLVAPVAEEISDDGIAASETFLLYCLVLHQSSAPIRLGGVNPLPASANCSGTIGVSLTIVLALTWVRIRWALAATS